MLKDYYLLTKPGIIRGNLMVAVAGFFFASRGNIDWSVLVWLIVGLGLVVASACVANNVVDRNIDKKMNRTKDRAVAAGRVSVSSAVTFSALLGIFGFMLLAVLINVLTGLLAAFGWLAYVWIYGVGKRASEHGTVIGSISGAVPPVIGYTAAVNNIDSTALLLFVILVFWQMPHFYSIALYRSKDYAVASIPVLPLKKGIRVTEWQIVIYIVGFIIASLMLAVVGPAGNTYSIIMLITGLLWLWLASRGFSGNIPTDKWAKSIFKFSLMVIMVFSLAISLDYLLP